MLTPILRPTILKRNSHLNYHSMSATRAINSSCDMKPRNSLHCVWLPALILASKPLRLRPTEVQQDKTTWRWTVRSGYHSSGQLKKKLWWFDKVIVEGTRWMLILKYITVLRDRTRTSLLTICAFYVYRDACFDRAELVFHPSSIIFREVRGYQRYWDSTYDKNR